MSGTSGSKPADLAPAGKTYKIIDLVGTSRDGYEAAIRHALGEARRTVKGLAWFEVSELRGLIVDADTIEFQAHLKVGFRVLHGDK